VASHEYRRYVLVFKAVTVKPTVWLTSPSSGTVSHVKNVAYGDTWADVRATSPVTLVRSMPISRLARDGAQHHDR